MATYVTPSLPHIVLLTPHHHLPRGHDTFLSFQQHAQSQPLLVLAEIWFSTNISANTATSPGTPASRAKSATTCASSAASPYGSRASRHQASPLQIAAEVEVFEVLLRWHSYEDWVKNAGMENPLLQVLGNSMNMETLMKIEKLNIPWFDFPSGYSFLLQEAIQK